MFAALLLAADGLLTGRRFFSVPKSSKTKSPKDFGE